MRRSLWVVVALLIAASVFVSAQGGGTVPVGPPLLQAYKVQLTMVPLDANGNQAQVYGNVTWSISDASIATIMPDPATEANSPVLTAWLVPVKPGDVTITAVADGDPSTTVRNVTATLKISIVGDATTAVIGVGTPVKR